MVTDLPVAIQIVASLIVIPWCIWVTVSLFNQRQEIALLKQILYRVSYNNSEHHK